MAHDFQGKHPAKNRNMKLPSSSAYATSQEGKVVTMQSTGQLSLCRGMGETRSETAKMNIARIILVYLLMLDISFVEPCGGRPKRRATSIIA